MYVRLKCLLIIKVLILSSTYLLAQPGNPPLPPGEPVPLQGIALLLLAGAFLGLKKYMNNKKAK